MKMNPRILSVWLLTFLIGGLAVGQEPDEQEAHLKPFPATERGATNIFTLAPQQTGIYNVRIDEQDNDRTYELDGDPNVTYNPGEDGSELWIWKKTGGGANTFEFKVVNTIWEERSVTVTVTCTWMPVPGDDDGEEGEVPGPIYGEAKGIADHQWGDMAVSTNISVQGAPDYLCLHNTATLSSWLVRDEEHEDYELIDSNWSVESICAEGGHGSFDPETGDTVVFTPTNTGLVRVTATESQYTNNSGTVEFTIVEVKIETEDEPGDLICVGGTREYTAVITPTNVQGSFTWSVSDTNNLDIVGADNQQTVTGKQASASMNAEELTVEFTVNGELICEPSTNLTVVDFTKLKLATSDGARFVEDKTPEYEPPSVTNTLYIVDGTNGMASMTIEGWWEPTGIESNRFLWRIVLTNETADPPEWDVTSSTFTTNPVTVTWDVADAAGGVTNREFIVRGWYDCDESGEYNSDFPHRELFVTVVWVDLDIDARNIKGLDDPDRSEEERAVKNDPDHPGKALAINHLDRNTNGVPDYASGYDTEFNNISQAGTNVSHNFVPVILEFSEGIDTNTATVVFRGDYISNPATDVELNGNGEADAPFSYDIVGDGRVRLWCWKNGVDSRLKASVADGGDAIIKDEVIPLHKLSPSNRVVRLYIEALRRSDDLGDIQIKVELSPTGSFSENDCVASNQVKATVFGVESVHPIAEDFAENHEGKVMISAKHGGGYHATNNVTTVAGTGAQTSDAEVTISAYILPIPPADYTNLTVYFEVTDPDDLSHYEGKTEPGTPDVLGDKNPNDNRDPLKQMRSGVGDNYTDYQEACLSVRHATPIIAEIADTTRAVAETTLQITQRYSGDNYQVRATMQKPHDDGPFDKRTSWTTNDSHVVSSIAETETMIAWKRVYIEQDNMYKLGATFYLPHNFFEDNMTVDSSADFNVNDEVVIFWKDGEFNATITEKPPSPVISIYVTTGGSGYTNIPNVEITGGGGEGASATAVMDTNTGSRVIRVQLDGGVVGGGSGYTNAPLVTIDPPGTPAGSQAQAVATSGRLSISGFPEGITEIPQWAGIRPAVETSTHVVDRRYLPQAYGSTPDGSCSDGDGTGAGAFIEFMDVPDNPHATTPKYTAFASLDHLRDYSNYWFYNSNHRTNNVLYLLAAYRRERPTAGGAWSMEESENLGSMCFIFTGIIPSESYRENVVAHEIGHRFDITKDTFPYVDTRSAVQNHADTDYCIMNYNSDPTNSITEFSLDAILRGHNGNPSLRDQKDK